MYYKIPKRFQREIILHALKNTQEHLLVDGASSILGVFGPPGEGKTVMCRQILESLGAKVHIMSVVDFESEDAGKPAERLKEKYSLAKKEIYNSDNNISVLIIDDADAALGNWGDDVQYTVNTQIVVGELMQLATNEKNRKVPIIITGNDFSKIYYPLRRSGRMTSFFWEPNEQERLDSVQMIFDWLTADECQTIIKISEEFAISEGLVRPPISFYASIKNKLLDDDLWQSVQEKRRNCNNLSYIKQIQLPKYNKYSCNDVVDLCNQELLVIKKGNIDYSGGKTNGKNSNQD